MQVVVSAEHDLNCTTSSDKWNAPHYVLNAMMWPPNVDIVRILLANGCVVNVPATVEAATLCADTISLLLDSGADPNLLDRESVSPFHRYFLCDAHRNVATTCEYPEKAAVLPLLPSRG